MTDSTTTPDPATLPTNAATPTGAEPAPRGSWLTAVPEAVPVAVAGFGLPAMVLLLAGRFQVPLVAVVGIAGAVVAVAVLGPERHVSGRFGAGRLGAGRFGGWRWTVAALLLAAAFAAFNAWYASEDLYARRDPSTYISTGQWLAHHPSLPIDTQHEVFATPTQSKLYQYSAGFGDDLRVDWHVDAQGNHLLPALLAVAGRFGGQGTLVRMNALIGAAALLAMFGLVRRFTGDPFALLATAALAVSLPMLDFSRDSYTEPLALLLLCGGLSVLWRAVESGRTAEFALAGLTAGATAMSRIDGFLPLMALLAVGVGYAGRARRGQRTQALRRVGALLAGLLVPAVVGYLDVTRLSTVYYHTSLYEIRTSLKAVALALAAGAAAVAACWLVPLLRRAVTGPARARVAWLAAAVVPAFFALLLARPLWLTSYEVPKPGQGCTALVTIVQARTGLPVQPCRLYDEYTAYWLTWYFGWPMLLLAVAGLAMLVHRTVRDADLRLLGIVAGTSAMCAIYLVHARITPDHVWAMRRYLPMVLPGLLGAAGYALSRLRDGRPGWLARRLAGGLAVLLVAVPAFVTHPMELVREDAGQIGMVQSLCRQVGATGAVLAVGESAAAPYLQAVRSACGVPAHGLGVAPEPTAAQVQPDLAAIRRVAEAHGYTLYVISQEPALVPWAGARPGPQLSLAVDRWPFLLDSVPQQAEHDALQLWVGVVQPDGTVRPAS